MSPRCCLSGPVSLPQLDTERANLTTITKFTWDFRRSAITVKEGGNGLVWSQSVGALPSDVQDIIALGGPKKWVKKQIPGP